MCKAGQSKTGGGVLARMRHLQGQIGESSPQSLGEESLDRGRGGCLLFWFILKFAGGAGPGCLNCRSILFVPSTFLAGCAFSTEAF